jgi:ribonuclease HI
VSELAKISLSVKGAWVENPGPGGYAAVLISGDRRKEIAGGRRLTTNNRLELMAAIAGLEALKWPCHVTVRSDSRYLVDGGNDRQTRRQVNRDLWDRLRDICEKHEIEFE